MNVWQVKLNWLDSAAKVVMVNALIKTQTLLGTTLSCVINIY